MSGAASAIHISGVFRVGDDNAVAFDYAEYVALDMHELDSVLPVRRDDVCLAYITVHGDRCDNVMNWSDVDEMTDLLKRNMALVRKTMTAHINIDAELLLDVIRSIDRAIAFIADKN